MGEDLENGVGDLGVHGVRGVHDEVVVQNGCGWPGPMIGCGGGVEERAVMPGLS